MADDTKPSKNTSGAPREPGADILAEQDPDHTTDDFLAGLDKASRRIKPVPPPKISDRPDRGSSRT